MKHLGNFVALLILAVNALFTGLLLFTAYSPHIQPVTHPVAIVPGADISPCS